MELKAFYSPLHCAWIVRRPDQHALVLASAKNKADAESLAAWRWNNWANRVRSAA